MSVRDSMERLVRTAIVLSLGGAALAIPPARAHAMRSVRFGRGLTSAMRTEPKSTVDDDVQRAVHDAFVRVHAARGSAIVMEAGTGRLIADYEHGVASNYRDLQNPGFTFVPFAIASPGAVEMGVFDLTTSCTGDLQIGGRIWHCTDGHAHGEHVTLIDALRAHCYIWFFNAARMVSMNMITGSGRAFGLGQSTESGVPDERRGLMPSRDDFTAAMRVWYLGAQIDTMIGYDLVRVTPIQLAVAYGALANGGHVVRPRLLERGNDPERSLRLDAPSAPQDVIDRVTTALAYAQADRASQLVGLASHPRELDASGEPSGTVQNWFAGYFPRAHPRYTVVVRISDATEADTRAREIATDAMNAMR